MGLMKVERRGREKGERGRGRKGKKWKGKGRKDSSNTSSFRAAITNGQTRNWTEL